jgi:hypothetical protein
MMAKSFNSYISLFECKCVRAESDKIDPTNTWRPLYTVPRALSTEEGLLFDRRAKVNDTLIKEVFDGKLSECTYDRMLVYKRHDMDGQRIRVFKVEKDTKLPVNAMGDFIAKAGEVIIDTGYGALKEGKVVTLTYSDGKAKSAEEDSDWRYMRLRLRDQPDQVRVTRVAEVKMPADKTADGEKDLPPPYSAQDAQDALDGEAGLKAPPSSPVPPGDQEEVDDGSASLMQPELILPVKVTVGADGLPIIPALTFQKAGGKM